MHIIQRHPTHDPETPTHNPETPTHTQILSIYTHTSLSISLTHKHTEPHSHSPSQIHPLIHIRNIQIHPLWTTKTHSHPHASSRYAPLPSRNVCKFTHTHPPKYIQLSHILSRCTSPHTPLTRYTQCSYPLHTTQMHPHSKLILPTQQCPPNTLFHTPHPIIYILTHILKYIYTQIHNQSFNNTPSRYTLIHHPNTPVLSPTHHRDTFTFKHTPSTQFHKQPIYTTLSHTSSRYTH